MDEDLVEDLRACANLHQESSLIFQLMHDAADALEGVRGERRSVAKPLQTEPSKPAPPPAKAKEILASWRDKHEQQSLL